jgi:hypothetical protein
MLISLGRRDLGEESIRAALAPVRAEATGILERGQKDGTFADHIPAPVLALATESLAMALLESQGPTGWSDPNGEAGATAVLIAAGVAPTLARRYVRTVLTEDHQHAQATATPAHREVSQEYVTPAHQAGCEP